MSGIAEATTGTPGVEEPGRIAVENPATGAQIGEVAVMGADEVAATVRRARVAQPGWEAQGFQGRARVLLSARRRLLNDAVINYLALEMPMGGWKDSGIGRRHGPEGIRKYCRQQSILTTRMGLRREVHMYPYRRTTTRLLHRLVQTLWGRGPRG